MHMSPDLSAVTTGYYWGTDAGTVVHGLERLVGGARGAGQTPKFRGRRAEML